MQNPELHNHIPIFRRETFEKRLFCVIPAQAGIQKFLKRMDSLFHGNDKLPGFERNSKVLYGLGAE